MYKRCEHTTVEHENIRVTDTGLIALRIDQLSYWGLMVGVGRGLFPALDINSLLRRGWLHISNSLSP